MESHNDTPTKTQSREGVDLGDGFGPFLLPDAMEHDDHLEFLIKTKDPVSRGYADSVVHRATEEFSDDMMGSKVEVQLKRREKELKERIRKAHTKSRNPKVRESFKKIREKLEGELLQIQDEMKGLTIKS